MSQFQYHELIENGSGLVEFILLFILLFVIVLPVFAVRAFLRHRSLDGAAVGARDLAIKIAIGIFAALPFCVILLAVPFGILNMIGIGVFHQDYYWPLIGPGLLVTYGIGTISVYRVIRAHRRKGCEKGERNAG